MYITFHHNSESTPSIRYVSIMVETRSSKYNYCTSHSTDIIHCGIVGQVYIARAVQALVEYRNSESTPGMQFAPIYNDGNQELKT